MVLDLDYAFTCSKPKSGVGGVRAPSQAPTVFIISNKAIARRK